MKEFIVIGRKWFDRVNGNTYHKVKVFDTYTDNLVFESLFSYGYGDQWKHTAYNALINLELVKAEDRNNHALNRKRFFYDCAEFTRKRDLEDW